MMTGAPVGTEDQIGPGSTTDSTVPHPNTHVVKIWEGKCLIKAGKKMMKSSEIPFDP